MRIFSGLLLLAAGLLAGCAAPPKHYPSETAAHYLGKPLLELEMHWSAPWSLSPAGGGQAATWRFDQYNLAGCTVTVHTDDSGVIRKVVWTPGCGPKGTGTGQPTGYDSP
ncbi:MAG: hypothetical protein KGL45_00750 [Gammaproteobacteria bacterium]|nr:hypothetical protein [Gammaproteobacteria bacterium]MDE2261031.1 hypothetical protein [Gammaproteobacteria bacterium]